MAGEDVSVKNHVEKDSTVLIVKSLAYAEIMHSATTLMVLAYVPLDGRGPSVTNPVTLDSSVTSVQYPVDVIIMDFVITSMACVYVRLVTWV